MTKIIVKPLDVTKDPIAMMDWPDLWPIPGPGEGIKVVDGIINNACAWGQTFEIVKREFIPLSDNPQIEVSVRLPLVDVIKNEKANRYPFRKRPRSFSVGV